MTMEGLLWLIVIGSVVYFIYYDHVYKRTKNYKEKQVTTLEVSADKLMADYFPLVDEYLASLATPEELQKYREDLNKRKKRVTSYINLATFKMGSLDNSEKVVKIILKNVDKFMDVKLKYIRLREKLKHGTINQRLEIAQDWFDYVSTYVSPDARYEPDGRSVTQVKLDEIDKRFGEKLKASSKY